MIIILHSHTYEMYMKNIIVFICCFFLGSCAQVPEAEKIIAVAEAQNTEPQIVGAYGPLTLEQSSAVLKDISRDDSFHRHVAIEEALAETPLVGDNHTRLLLDGRETLPAMFMAIEGAKHHINLEYYIFQNVEFNGVKLQDLLLRKRQQGVEVNIIYDSFGSSDTSQEFFNSLKEAGVKIVQYNPLNPLMSRKDYAPNERTHRKILTVDGTLAIIGGINMSDTYEEDDFGKSTGPPGTTQEQWRDTDIEIRGPVVAQLDDLFLDHWYEQKGPSIDINTFFPPPRDKGKEIIRILGSAPENSLPRYYVALYSAIRNSSKNVWLMTAYFVPTDDKIEILSEAAQRGVDVRLLLPKASDSREAIAMQRSSYGDLLESGVRVFETTSDVVLHSKVAVVDGVWVAIGSSNLDHRSVLYNDEVDAVILGEKTGQATEKMFLDDLELSHEITLEEWRNRPLIEYLYEIYARLWRKLL